VLVVGKPGSGKSTSLRRLLWEEAGRCLEAIKQGKSEIPQIPILIELRSLSGSVLSAIQEKLEWWLDLDEKTSKALLRDRRLLVLLDGLNELPNDKAWQAVDEFRQLCADLKVSLIITTRELGSGLVQGIAKKLEMLPLTEPQMREFVQKRLPQRSRQLWGQIQGRLRELAETPLLLKLLCDVFEQNGGIPESRGDLFRKEFKRRYEEFKPERLRNVSEDSRRFAFDLLKDLAFTMVKGEPHTNSCKPSASWITISRTDAEKILATSLAGDRTPDVADMTKAKEWLEDLLEWHLLQVASDRDRIEFQHQLFQEYYAAECLLPKLVELSNEELKYYYLNYLKWTEPLAMAITFVDSPDLAMRVVKLALKVDVCLGARLAGEVEPKFQKEAVGLVAVLDVPQPLKIYLYGITRSDRVIPALEQALVSGKPSIHDKVLEALERVGNEATIPILSQALEHENYWLGSKVARVLGKIGSEKAIPDLRKALVVGNPLTRAAAASALGQIASPEAVPALLQALEDDNLKVREKAASALAAINGEAVIAALVQHLEHQDFHVHKYAALALGKMGHEAAIPTLRQALEDWNSQADVNPIIRFQDSFSSSAIFALAKIKSEDAVLALLQTSLEQDESFLRRIAIDNLKEIGHHVTIPSLLNALEVEDCIIRSRAAEALGKIGSEEVIPHLIKAFNNNSPCVRWSIAIALGEIGNKNSEVVSTLLQALEKEEYDDRLSAAIALGKLGIPEALKNCCYEDCYQVARALRQIGNQEVIITLLEALDDEDFDVCRIVAYELGQIGKPAIPALREALKNKNPTVCEIAARALGRVGGEDDIPVLLQNLEGQSHQIRASAAETLGTIGSKEVIPALFQALEVKNPLDPLVVHPKVIEAIGKIGNPEVLPELNELLSKPKSTVRDNLLAAIAAIQSRCGFYNYEIFQQAKEAENLGFEDNFIRNFYEDLDQVISNIQENPKQRQKDTEDRLTIDIVNQLRCLGYYAEHDSEIGDHVDIVVKKNKLLWLGEAKIYRDNNYLWEGFQQLTTRYSIGDSNQENGGFLIYIREGDASSIMEKWQNYLLEKSLPNYSFRSCETGSLAFISTHKHERSGRAFHVRHMPVMLHFAPKDKSGRGRKESP
jgi:HEAT repeat protein